VTRETAIIAAIRRIPKGKVSTYGAVARAAGHPRHARQVARILGLSSALGLAWHRVAGAGGEIKLRGHSALEQRFRLQAEGVGFRGRRIDMARYAFQFSSRRAPGKQAGSRKPGGG
jgi:methylated-DNA-protein-cysteine methyltransferase related protein